MEVAPGDTSGAATFRAAPPSRLAWTPGILTDGAGGPARGGRSHPRLRQLPERSAEMKFDPSGVPSPVIVSYPVAVTWSVCDS
jgi:hypothetical protein